MPSKRCQNKLSVILLKWGKKKKKVTLLNKEILFNILVPMRSELVDDTQNNVHRKGGEGRKKRKRIKKKRKKTE